MGEHELARPVCSTTKRVAEVAAELYAGDRWSPKVHGFCTDQGRRDAVMGVMIIMLRKAGKGEGRARPREGDKVTESTAGEEQQQPQLAAQQTWREGSQSSQLRQSQRQSQRQDDTSWIRRASMIAAAGDAAGEVKDKKVVV